MNNKTAGLWSAISFCVGMGFQVSGYQNIYLASAFWAGALLLALYTLRGFIPVGRLNPMMPLHEAATRAYTGFRGSSIWADAAERMAIDKSPEGILNYIALGMALEVQVYGKWTPSTKFKPVDKKYFNRGSIEGGGRSLNIRADHPIDELSIKRSDLRAAIKRMQTNTASANS